MKKGHGKRGIMFETAPVVDLIDTREIIQSLESDPEFVRVHGSSDGELGSTPQTRGQKKFRCRSGLQFSSCRV